MERADAHRSLPHIAIGAFGAISLGAVLVPLRELTSAANLAFPFLIWTIVMGELGGRAAAVVTALVSGLSLNFFLTKPYLTLVISDPDDMIAFGALTVAGLVAAAFGRRREAVTARSADLRADLEAVQRVSECLDGRDRLDERLTAALEETRRSFRLGAVVLRPTHGRPLTVGDPSLAALGTGAVGPVELDPKTLLPTLESDVRFGENGVRLPAPGGRVPLRRGGESVGSLELWEGDPTGLTVGECQALGLVACRLAAELSLGRHPHEPG